MPAVGMAAFAQLASGRRLLAAPASTQRAVSSESCCMLSSGLLSKPEGRQGDPAPLKPEWAAPMDYVAELTQRSIHPAEPPFAHEWLENGPGYCYGPAFGHYDIVHQVLDIAPLLPEIARKQMLNLLSLQRQDGSIPFVWMGENPTRSWLPPKTPMATRLKDAQRFPPLWPAGVEACLRVEANAELLERAYEAVCRTLARFDAVRKSADGGYYYADIHGKGDWESGTDQGIRFQNPPPEPAACVDATSHIYWCQRFAAEWARRLGKSAEVHDQALERLGKLIQTTFFCEETAWFHDSWAVKEPKRRHYAFEGMWPIVVGAASASQARQALEQTLLNPERFNTPHPIATIARCDPAFKLRMLHGPAWNSFTLWAVEGCLKYGQRSGARQLLEKALDGTAAQFKRTGTVWEFYHPLGGEPETLERKPGRTQKGPCRDYLGHNPLRAMARLWAGLG
jgi:putative isomerase